MVTPTPSAVTPPSPVTVAPLPWVGIAAVLVGALATTVTSRLTSVGLADVRGAVGAGFDEGAWIPTAFAAAQMLIGPLAIFLGRAFSARRVLVAGALLYGLAETMTPFSTDVREVIVLQVLAGLGSGTFIPLTASFILLNLPRHLWPWGLAAYAMNIVLGLNVTSSLEGWYVNHLTWSWIFWQNALLAAPLALLYAKGLPKVPVDRAYLRLGDYRGMIAAGVALTLIYIGLDQGDRLQWLDSPLIVGLIGAGFLAMGAFFLIEAAMPVPSIDLRLLFQTNVLLLIVLIIATRLLVTASNTLVVNFLAQVRGLRPEEIGNALLWVALPQLIIAPAVAWFLGRIDARMAIGLGFAIAAAGFVMATGITSQWAEGDFLPALLVQAVGETLELTAIVYFFGHHVSPANSLTFGALVQVGRLFGGELGTSGLAVFVRKAEQVHSHLIGEHVAGSDALTSARLVAYTQLFDRASQGVGVAQQRGVALLVGAVRQQAVTLATLDGFLLAGTVAAAASVVCVALRRAPAPAAAIVPAPATPASQPL